jgi:hypothetical protein
MASSIHCAETKFLMPRRVLQAKALVVAPIIEKQKQRHDA